MNHHLCVAVHGGAGVHDPSQDQKLKKILRLACKRSLIALDNSGLALNAVQDAVCILEDDHTLNAGYGSNLTLDGHVECDAALMDGTNGEFGSVGAVSGVKNPIRAARAILEYGRVPDPLGRLPPLTLVGSGAHAFASIYRVPVVPPESLIAPRALGEWRLWKQRLEAASNSGDLLGSAPGALQDTVGAVALDSRGGVAAGVSSGGLLLKCSGRIGEAAVYGSGCWAAQNMDEGVLGGGSACSISGAGEHIMRVMLARTIGDALTASPDADPHQILRWALVDVFWKACRDRGINDECKVGVLLLTRQDDGEGGYMTRLWCAFTTRDMAIAYASSKDPTPKALVLRRPENSAQADGVDPPLYITALSL